MNPVIKSAAWATALFAALTSAAKTQPVQSARVPSATILGQPLLNTLRLPEPETLGHIRPPNTPDCSSASENDDCSSPIFLYRGKITYMLDGVEYPKDICVAISYHVNVKVGATGSKKVNYTLESRDPKIVKPRFIGAEIKKPAKDADGEPVVSANKDKLTIKTKRRKPKDEIVFLPLIQWANGNEDDLCAAVDPKIVNVP